MKSNVQHQVYKANRKPFHRMCSLAIAYIICFALLINISPLAKTTQPNITAQTATFGQFVGTNSFFNENQEAYDIVGNVREYHPWGFTEWTTGWYDDSNGLFDDSIKSMIPHAAFMNAWDAFDNYYKTMHERGIDVTICLSGTADSRPKPDYQNLDGTRSEDPSSYLGHGQSMFQLAARYGSNTNIDPSLVRVSAGTEKLIGLGYVQYYENYNEPINYGFDNGRQFAAMLSADYDGHMGTLGPDVGVKQADPNAKVVFGGSYVGWFADIENGRFTFEFLAQMMDWFDENRTLEQWKAANGGSEAAYVKYPFDVVSAHGYSWDNNGNGICAEDSRYYSMLKAFVENCSIIFPAKECFFSEFGWDTSPNSTNRAITPGLSTQETQGRWLVREYLITAAAGINRARQFMMPDTSDNRNNSDWFGTSGMIHGIQGSNDFKTSWYYVGTMGNVLKDASLADIRILSDGGWSKGSGIYRDENFEPWAIAFSSSVNSDQIYALWLPTALGDQEGANRSQYSITVPAGYTSATLVSLMDKSIWGERSDISNQIQNGNLTISIGEKPIFMILSENTENEAPGSEQNEAPLQSLIVKPTAATVLINGEIVLFDAYLINNNNYFKLRDIAFALTGTISQFEVEWDDLNKQINLISEIPYTLVGGEMSSKGTEEKLATLTSSRVFLDGEELFLTAYHIEGNNYFMLREIAAAIDFHVSWDESHITISIDSNKPY
ncbi:MAG: copper amine oxidase N-terminal domain-containing protein [Oscillospiraceae bacterium]|nr:copper amine oxidase N-terminal domain-containing protein [Oscillospiraceae bacterium]